MLLSCIIEIVPQLHNPFGTPTTMNFTCSFEFPAFPSQVLVAWKPSFVISTFLNFNLLSRASYQNLQLTNQTIVFFGSIFPSLWQSSMSFKAYFC